MFRLLAIGLSALLALAACTREAPSAPTASTDDVPSTAAAKATAPVAATAPADDRVFEPGRRFGAVTSTTGHAALEALYGAQVHRRDWEIEGDATPATVVFPDSDDEFWVLWKDAGFQLPETILVHGRNWHSAEGLRVGADLATLRRINGDEFEFGGFDWDYGGYVSSWRKGRLSAYAGKLSVQLDRQPPEGADDTGLVGDGVELVSDNPALAGQRVTVGRIHLSF